MNISNALRCLHIHRYNDRCFCCWFLNRFVVGVFFFLQSTSFRCFCCFLAIDDVIYVSSCIEANNNDTQLLVIAYSTSEEWITNGNVICGGRSGHLKLTVLTSTLLFAFSADSIGRLC